MNPEYKEYLKECIIPEERPYQKRPHPSFSMEALDSSFGEEEQEIREVFGYRGLKSYL